MGARKVILPAVLVAIGVPAVAQDQSDFRKTMARCEGIADVAQRVACYDRAAAQLHALPADPVARAESPAAVEKRQRALFGLFGREREHEVQRQQPERPPAMKELTSQVVARSEAAPGAWRITLRDGGTWQTEPRSDFRPPKIGATVDIHRGGLGGYLLSVGSQASVRVSRLN